MSDKDTKQPIAGIADDEIITEINSLCEGTWTGTKPARLTQTLKSLTATVTAQTNAEKGTLSIPAKVIKSKGNAIGEAISIYQQASEGWKKGTLPTDVKGRRLVKTTEVARIRKELDKFERDLVNVRRKIVANWDGIHAASVAALGDNISDVDVPSDGKAFADQFTVGVRWSGAPVSIRKGTAFDGLTDEISNRIIAESEKGVIATVSKAHAEPLTKLDKLLGETLTAVGKGKRLHQSRFDKLAEAAAELDKSNWFKFPEIAAVIRDLQELGGINRDALDEDNRKIAATGVKKLRKKAKTAAEQLASIGI